MNVLPILKTDFVEVCEAQINGTLNDLNVEFEKKATVCKYVVPNGYPDNPCKGDKIEVGEIPEGVKVYYASVDQREDGLYLSGSRAVAFVGIADTLGEAEKLAQSALYSVKGPVFYREDIGTAKLVQKRVDHMRELRG
ncbi:phosphoribosylamine--glycine ligase, partial [Patescibacteria group bacterium]|nr:phosphoribosylamine--glycine ligase [Patescibacteria group bacterium]